MGESEKLRDRTLATQPECSVGQVNWVSIAEPSTPSHQKTEKSASLITSKGFRANVEAEKSPQLSTGIQKEQLFMGRFFRRLADFSR